MFFGKLLIPNLLLYNELRETLRKYLLSYGFPLFLEQNLLFEA
jgi:hypothetical protein